MADLDAMVDAFTAAYRNVDGVGHREKVASGLRAALAQQDPLRCRNCGREPGQLHSSGCALVLNEQPVLPGHCQQDPETSGVGDRRALLRLRIAEILSDRRQWSTRDIRDSVGAPTRDEVNEIAAELGAAKKSTVAPGEVLWRFDSLPPATPEPQQEVGADRDGAEMILAERLRQVAVDGEDWTLEHDDTHDQGELVAAAIAYANPPLGSGWAPPDQVPDGWPFEPESYKPKDQVSNLVRAGALIAAEIDRLRRAEADHG